MGISHSKAPSVLFSVVELTSRVLRGLDSPLTISAATIHSDEEEWREDGGAKVFCTEFTKAAAGTAKRTTDERNFIV